ncbi:hypothetical protein BSF38_05078 [Paludisphaera borealis]|uniref:Uncharacterized protein n=1 Tax=Paludisphaera borealis TaxID=1387353 RepID=A0A1U7CX79_9BACT|nr:hypothetical protein BSF38_05078 [Paludisphaera borealis]
MLVSAPLPSVKTVPASASSVGRLTLTVSALSRTRPQHVPTAGILTALANAQLVCELGLTDRTPKE